MQTNCRNPVSILVFIPSSYSIGDFPDVGEGRNPVSILVFIPSIRFGAGTMIHVQWSQSSINPGFHSESAANRHNCRRTYSKRSQSSINPGFHSEVSPSVSTVYTLTATSRNPVSILVFIPSIRFGAGTMIHVQWSQSSINPGFHSENSFYNAQRLGWQRSQSSINPGFHSEYMDVGLADYSFELSQSSINPGFHSEQQRLYPPHPTP